MLDRSIFSHGAEPHLSRFLATVTDSSGHWLWTGRVNPSGYGVFALHGQTVGAHRLAFEWANGPIHAWMEIDHTCRRPLCVRPLHMEPVTHLENVRRGKTAESIRQSDHPLANYLFDHEVSIAEFARSVFVSPATVSKMIRGYRPSDPDAVYRVGGAIGLSWEQADAAFPRKGARA